MDHGPVHLATTSHPHSRYLGLIAFALILLTAMVAVPSLAGASTYQAGFNVSLDPNDRIDGNLYLSALQVNVEGDAPNDAYIMAVDANLNGDVSGSLTVVSATTEITGAIGGSLHVVSGQVDFSGRVDGDLVVAGGQVTLSSGSTIGGDVILAGGTAIIDGAINGSIYAATLSTAIDGTVVGNAELQAMNLNVDNGARIGGALRYQSPLDADVDSAAIITGDVTRTNGAPWTGIGDGALAPFGSIVRLVWALILGALIVAAAPRVASRVAEHGASFLRPSVIGLICIVAVPLISLLAFLSIVGIPVGVLLLILLGIVVYLSQVFAGLTIGRYLMPRSWQDGSRGYLLLAMTIGVLIITALRMVPVPYLGSIATALVTFWGTGAAVLILTDLTSRRLREPRAGRDRRAVA